MSNLYENAEGTRVTVIARDARYYNGISEVGVVVYRGISIMEDAVGVRVATAEVFAETFKLVKWNCGVDLYAILHQHLGKDAAANIANEIEAELAAKTPRFFDPDKAAELAG